MLVLGGVDDVWAGGTEPEPAVVCGAARHAATPGANGGRFGPPVFAAINVFSLGSKLHLGTRFQRHLAKIEADITHPNAARFSAIVCT